MATAHLSPDTDTVVFCTTTAGTELVLGYLRVSNWGDAASPVYARHVEDDRPWNVWPHAGIQVSDCRHDELVAARRIFGDDAPEGATIATRDPSSHDARARELVGRSVSLTAIVCAEHTTGVASRLQRLCDGDTYDARREVHEYWGTTDDGEEWRVHLANAPR